MYTKLLSAKWMSLVLVIISGFFFTSSFAKEGSETSSSNRWIAPSTAKSITNPLTATPDVISAGRAIFVQQCAVCHGNSGKGDGPTAQYLGKKLPDFTSTEFSQQTDGEIFWKISNGNAPMPTFKDVLTEQQRWEVVNYLRTFASHK